MVHYERSHNKEMKVILTNGGKVDHYDEQIEMMLDTLKNVKKFMLFIHNMNE